MTQQNLHTILLIDDGYAKFISGFSKMGKSFGFSIRAFDSIAAGLSFLNSNKKEISAVLLDLSFSANNFEGAEALKIIKINNALLPVIILTESHSEKDIEAAVNCMKRGAFNYVVKTNFDSASLFKMLNVAVTQYETNTSIYRYNTLKEEYRNKASVFEQMLQTTEMILKNILTDKLMFSPTFERRLKDFNSFYDKIISKEKSEDSIVDPFSRITDIAGLRVIFYNSADLQKAIELLTASNDFINAKKEGSLVGDDRSKSYGYRAVHFDIKINPKKRLHLDEYQRLANIFCEIQFKTIFAHSWSKVYHALSYKQADEMRLKPEEQERLDADFKEAAKNLESVEQQITTLCAKYFLSTANKLTGTN